MSTLLASRRSLNEAPIGLARVVPSGSAMLSERAWAEIAHSLHLSGRELQVVRATFDDKTEATTAHDLGVASRTVHTHVERLHRKLNVTDRQQLILRICQEFLHLTLARHSSLPPICPNEVAGCCPLHSRASSAT